jgi:ATP-dependent Clp protease protease subunit
MPDHPHLDPAWAGQTVPPQMLPPQVQRSRDFQWQRRYTVGELLMENRIIFFGMIGDGHVSDSYGQFPILDLTANYTIQQLLLLRYQNKNQEIHFYINSPGGSVSATLAIYDTMQFLECPISTYCMGMAASGAAILLAAGSKKKRYILPHGRVMIHQPWGQIPFAQATDVEIEMAELEREKRQLIKILAKHTGRPEDEIERKTERNYYLTAEEAKEFGLVDEVLPRMAEQSS